MIVTPTSVSYSASDNQFPDSPIGQFNADHPASTTPGSPYYHMGYNTSDSMSGGLLRTGVSNTARYTFGYINTLTIDPTVGMEFNANLRLTSEYTVPASAANRGGFALAVTDKDNKYIEFFFHANEIFVNGAGRIRSQTYAMDTTQFHDYTVRLLGSTVTLAVDGVDRLSGTTFDASTTGAPTLANWMVIGDITSSGYSSFDVSSFSASVPEPTAGALFIGIAGLAMCRRHRRDTKI